MGCGDYQDTHVNVTLIIYVSVGLLRCSLLLQARIMYTANGDVKDIQYKAGGRIIKRDPGLSAHHELRTGT